MRDTFDLPWFDVSLIKLALEVDRGPVAMQFFQWEFETLARSFENQYPDFDLMRGDGIQSSAKPIIIEPGGIDSEQIVYSVLRCLFAHPVKWLRIEGQLTPAMDESIVRVAFEWDAWEIPLHPHVKRIMQEEIGEQRTHYSSLRRSRRGWEYLFAVHLTQLDRFDQSIWRGRRLRPIWVFD